MLRIGDLARLAGTTARTVRHYHAEGLLPAPARDQSGYRRYGASALIRLVRIRRLRELGLPLDRIAELLDGEPTALLAALAALDAELAVRQEQLAAKRARISALQAAPVDPELPPGLAEVFGQMAERGYEPRYLAQEKEAVLLGLAVAPEIAGEMISVYRRVLDNPAGPDRVIELTARWEALADEPEDSLAVERLVADAAALSLDLLGAPVPEPVLQVPEHTAQLLYDDWFTNLAPAQRRAIRLLERRMFATMPAQAPTDQ